MFNWVRILVGALIKYRHMNIGTHNSLTYLTPKTWWGKLLKFTARCQSIDYEKQYELGARVFDVRLWYDNRICTEIRHGRIAYSQSHIALYEMLKFLNKKGDCYVRILCEEDSFAKHDPLAVNKEHTFIDDCAYFENSYKNIKFFGGNRKYDWKVLYEFKNKDIPTLVDKYSSTTSLFKNDNKFLRIIDDLCPILYAKLKNHQNIEEHKQSGSKDYLFIDFINIQ